MLACDRVEQTQQLRHRQIGLLGPFLRREPAEADHVREQDGGRDLFGSAGRAASALMTPADRPGVES